RKGDPGGDGLGEESAPAKATGSGAPRSALGPKARWVAPRRADWSKLHVGDRAVRPGRALRPAHPPVPLFLCAPCGGGLSARRKLRSPPAPPPPPRRELPHRPPTRRRGRVRPIGSAGQEGLRGWRVGREQGRGIPATSARRGPV